MSYTFGAVLVGLAYLFGTGAMAFGLNAILRPTQGLSFFELKPPKQGTPERTTVEALMVIYGVRDVFMGFVVWIAGLSGSTQTLGWIILAGSGVALGDGYVCLRFVGRGQGAHWACVPVYAIIGGLLILGWGS